MLHIYKGIYPKVAEDVFIAEGSHIIGYVTIEKNCSIWFGAVLRGDDNYITVGEGTNIQDNSVIHGSKDTAPTIIGKYVTIGHNAIIHGAEIGDNCLIGMGSIIMNNCKIGKNTIIGAGSLIPGGKEIPEGVLCMGSPAKIIRNLTEEEYKKLRSSAEHYIKMMGEYNDKRR
ncbi:gamma carbonic anhydrase family protein [Clostridium thermarum]|uniref:gamma carbonic anhydrase family protein n=1 Tax=Clostridium thermarum TaxID=1716543 RepID=UPI00111C968C|nr:gamma carbonic anhydrase family protein [Clostridium thermarum]